MKKKIIILITLFVLLIIVALICYYIYNNKKLPTGNIIYRINYYDDYDPGSKSDIFVYDDGVEIITTHFCSAINCDSKTEKETFIYSLENINKLKQFINNNFITNNQTIKINESDLNEYQKWVFRGLLLGEYFFETNVEEYKYKIEYSKTDNISYDIYFKSDKSILVKKLKINDNYDIVKIDTYSLNFNNENLDILNDYIEKEVKKENSSIVYKSATLQKDEINIINSIIENNELYLKDIDRQAKLLYTISYNGINCHTPTLYLYNDNTYEYYYTFSVGDELLIPKTGTYNYDVSNIINNVNKYEEDRFGPYVITDQNDIEYITYSTNKELKELLNQLNVKLEACLEQQ